MSIPAGGEVLGSPRSKPAAPAAPRSMILAGVAAALFGAALAELLNHAALSLSLPVVVGGAVALVLALVLVITRYELAVAIGVFTSAIVFVEPPPADALFALIIVVSMLTGRFRLSAAPRLAVVLVGSFLVLNLLSMGAVTEWSRAARFFIITLYLGVFGLWLAGYLDRPNRARLVVRAYLVSALLSAAFTVAAELVSFPLHELFIGDNVRGKGLFKDPNVYGPFLIPIALIMAEEIFNPRLLRLRRSLKVASFLMLALGVLFSYSRAAWLNLTVGLLVLVVVVVVRRPDRKAVSLVLVLITAALTLAAAVVVSGSLGFLKERAKLQGYDTERFAAQDRGLSFGLHHIFGVGPGQFEVLSPVATHSLYIRSFAEQGVLGLAVIILIVLSTLVFALVNVVRGRDTYGISAAALLAAWCGLVCNSFFVDTMHWRHLWLVLGLIWAGAARTQLGSNWFRASALPVPGLPPVNGARSLDVRTD